MTQKTFEQLKLEIQILTKRGIDFIFTASLLWLVIAYIWTLDFSSYDRSIITFIVGAFLLPMAFGMSKVFKTSWKIKNNPLDPLGLYLNFAQLIYFPFLIFILIKYPDYFIMTYAIITGAHLFPYAWYYDEIGYAVMAIIISLGSLLIALNTSIDTLWMVPLFTSIMFVILSIWIYISTKKLPKLEEL